MGFFTKDVTPNAAPAAFTFDRLTAALDANEWNYGTDDERTEAYGTWDDHPFTFSTSGKDGETLYVRARWARDLPIDAQPGLLIRVNDWHADTHWPKVVVRAFDDGTLGVFAELSVNYRSGVTDDQLTDHLNVAIGTSLSFFEQLDEGYPEAVAKAQESN
ncbi:YbjN domain-containing protein [Cellulomonas sp. RIT-PI-Y]|jgi:hypothetical protein|uniref:YbjN domain-containing protein n=1 Tax=Cellulomonas sp. RIT-PI-Y TaxID=3035297 RepID=UPI0021DA5D7F|nr:YbjN domain-containing protein [Cellulomonas sp. RIT-PI-Y]